MILAIDIGNTNIVAGLFDGDELLGCARVETAVGKAGTADAIRSELETLAARAGRDAAAVDGVAIASVVPQATDAVAGAVTALTGQPPLLIRGAETDLGIKVHVAEPQYVGDDRLVNAVAGHARHGGPLLILDFGTATTFDVVDAEGGYVGGVIAPGVHLSLKALTDAAALLPPIPFEPPKSGRVTGTDTLDAMRSGLYWGYAGLIEGITRRLREEHQADMKLVATGGLAPVIARATDIIDAIDPDLTLHGIRLVYERNRGTGA